MERERIVAGLFAEYEAFAALIQDLRPDEWSSPTRCAGWQVRDVAGHVIGNAVDTMTGVIGTRKPDEQARAFRERGPGDLAAELRRAAGRLRPGFEGLSDRVWDLPSPVAGRSNGNGIHSLWYDTFVHADDIRVALGRPVAGGPGLAASVEWLCEELERLGRGPARLVVGGVGEHRIGDGGPELRADAREFVLVASGRADPAAFGVGDWVNVYS